MAFDALKNAGRFSERNSKSLSLGYLLAKLGRADEARDVLRTLEAVSRARSVSAVSDRARARRSRRARGGLRLAHQSLRSARRPSHISDCRPQVGWSPSAPTSSLPRALWLHRRGEHNDFVASGGTRVAPPTIAMFAKQPSKSPLRRCPSSKLGGKKSNDSNRYRKDPNRQVKRNEGSLTCGIPAANSEETQCVYRARDTRLNRTVFDALHRAAVSGDRDLHQQIRIV